MRIQITNASGHTMNDLDALTGGSGPSGLNAVGGARKDPLPYPFAHIGALTNSSSSTQTVHPRDLRKQKPSWDPHDPSEEWNALLQAGKVTAVYTAESAPVTPDFEELALEVV